MNLSSRPIHNPAVLTRKLFDSEMVLVNADTAISLALTNETAVIVWEMADGKNKIQDIIDTINHQFQNVPDDTVLKDIQELIELLARDGFIGFEVE